MLFSLVLVKDVIMPETDYDGIIALSDASIREATAQAEIAKTMAETAIKWEECQHQHLQNIGLFLKIKWDAKAHDNLHRLMLEAQHEVKERERVKRVMESKVIWASKLLRGTDLSIETLPQAWVGFYFIRDHVKPQVVINAYKKVPIPEGVFDTTSWAHPFMVKDGSVVHDYTGRKDPTELFKWAARNNYYPVFTEPAWEYITEFFTALNEGADAEAQRMVKEIEEARQRAMELSKLEWERLQQKESQSNAM